MPPELSPARSAPGSGREQINPESRRIMQQRTATIRLNVGSGPHVVPGWTSIDKSLAPLLDRAPLIKKAFTRIGILDRSQDRTVWPRGIIRLDVTKRLPYETGTVDAIYSSHFVEHLDRAEADRFLRESLRVLRAGGVLRLAMPDLQKAARDYLARLDGGDAEAANAFIDFLYFRPEHHGSHLRRLVLRALHRPHGWMYDAVSLAARLRAIGFERVTERPTGEADCPDADILDTRPESFFLEARAPTCASA